MSCKKNQLPSNISVVHTVLSEKCQSDVTIYEIQLHIVKNSDHATDCFFIRDTLLTNPCVKLTSVVSSNSHIIPINLSNTALISEGNLIDSNVSKLCSFSDVILTYKLSVSRCNDQLFSVVTFGRKCRTYGISSIVLCKQKDSCESKCIVVNQCTTMAPMATSDACIPHECGGYDVLQPIPKNTSTPSFTAGTSKPGGKVILEALMENQKTSDPTGQTNAIAFGLAGSSSFQWNQILQDAIDYVPPTPADNYKKLNMVNITNESAGAYEAQNFSNDKKVGFVFTTRGPGITMALTGIASAMREELPMLYICGVSPTDIKDEFQNLDLSTLSKVTKKTFRITRKIICMQNVTDIINEACFIAINGTKENPGKGPVALMVDFDFWRTPMSITCNSCWVPPRHVLTGNEDDALWDLINRWNRVTGDTTKTFLDPPTNSIPKGGIIVMRVGTRCSPETARKMVELADYFPQMYVVSSFDARGMIDPMSSPKYLDVQGPAGNRSANAAVTLALTNPNSGAFRGLVIDAGVGVLYTTLSDDINGNIPLNSAIPLNDNSTSNVLRLFDEPIEKDGYLVNVNYVLNKLYDLVLPVDQGKLFKNNIIHVSNFGDPNVQFRKIYDEYVRQGPNAYYYPGNPGPTIETPIQHALPSVGHNVARCMKNFFDDATGNNEKTLVIDSDEYYHVYDSGTAAFMAGQLGRMKYSHNDGNYTEYSAIGLSMSSAAGKIWGNPKHAVVYIGDGAFMNMMASIIDLKQAAIENGKKALLLYFNDYRYGNVALGDLALAPNKYTTIAITEGLLNQYDEDAMMTSVCTQSLPLVPDPLGHPARFRHASNDADIDDFIQNTFKNPNTKPGLYVLRTDGETTRIVRPNATSVPSCTGSGPSGQTYTTRGADYPRNLPNGAQDIITTILPPPFAFVTLNTTFVSTTGPSFTNTFPTYNSI